MKKKRLPVWLYRAVSALPLMLMIAALYLAYAGGRQEETAPEAGSLGTVTAGIDWKVRLKDNPFYAGRELGGDYAFIMDLVDQVAFRLNLALDGAPEDAAAVIAYQVDGTLLANYKASGGGLLLRQEYPKLAAGTVTLDGSGNAADQPFDLALTSYSYVIDSFQSAYRVDVSSRLELRVSMDATLETGGERYSETLSLPLSIPLDSNVFQITGTPSDTQEFDLPAAASTAAQEPHIGTLAYLLAAVVLLLLFAATVLFLGPLPPDPAAAELKSILQKCRGSLVRVGDDPRDKYTVYLPLGDSAALVRMAESTGQPVLHLQKEDAHRFFVSAEGILYGYEPVAGGQGAAAEEKARPIAR